MQAAIVELIRSRDFRPLYAPGYLCGMDCHISKEQYERDLDSLPALLKMRLSWMNKARLIREYTRCMDWQIAEVQKPYPLRSKTWPFPESSDGVENMIYPQFVRTPIKLDLCETQDAFLTTMLALHAFRLEKGRYPARLNELVPTYLSAVPLDPFSNRQPLRYQLKPVRYFIRSWSEALPATQSAPAVAPAQSGPGYLGYKTHRRYGQMAFRIYSVGFNSRDDGGVPYENDKATDQRRHKVDGDQSDMAKCDIVAGINQP